MMRMMNDTARRWMRQYHQPREHAPLLLCLPHAGGAAPFFQPLSALLAPDIQLLAVQYPGRQDRLAEAPITHLPDYVPLLASQIALLAPSRLSLFGHSMGAMLAFELAAELANRGILVETLFLSSHAPEHRAGKKQLHKLDDPGLVEALIALGEQGSELLRDADFCSLLLPMMRADLTAVENHRLNPRRQLTGTTICTSGGSEDARVSLAEMLKWREKTDGPFSQHPFTGGHFYLKQHVGAIARLIRQHAAMQQNSPQTTQALEP